MFKAHSTRAVATSAVKNDVDINTIMKTAGWARARTFATYYNKPISTEDKFGTAVLSK